MLPDGPADEDVDPGHGLHLPVDLLLRRRAHEPDARRLDLAAGVQVFTDFYRSLEGSFSAGSKPICATKY